MLYCTQTGPVGGEPVLFLHAGGYSGTMWHDIAGRLTQMRCILADLPGHGQSRSIALTSLAQAADGIADIIVEKYDRTPVTIIGLSFGGYVGLFLMARHPRLVRRAMLSGIHLGSVPNPLMIKLMSALMSPFIRLPWFRRKMAAALGVTDPQIYGRSDGTANVSPRTFRQVMNLVSVFNVYDVLLEIDVPTLLVAGANEHQAILRSLVAYQRLMPVCTARTVPQMGHAWCNQDPALFARTVTSWVSGAPLPPRTYRHKCIGLGSCKNSSCPSYWSSHHANEQ